MSEGLTRAELDHIYCGWTGALHKWVGQLCQGQINVEYNPVKWEIHLWPGQVNIGWGLGLGGTFGAEHPVGTSTMALPPEGATQAQVNEAFKALCLEAAQLLNIDLGKARLANGPAETRSLPAPDPADGKPRRSGVGKRKRLRGS